MRILVIGGVAAGTSAAAKARRNNEDAKIVIYERDSFISYSGCGMPYFIGGEVKDSLELTPRDPEFFKRKYNIDVKIMHEVLSINTEHKTLEVKDLSSGKVFTDNYDVLILATGAYANKPQIKGVDRSNVFSLRNIHDMNKIYNFIGTNKPKSAAVVGSGFIGLEMCENLVNIGLDVTVIELLPQVTPSLDEDMSKYVRDTLEKNGVRVLTNVSVSEITDDNIVLSDDTNISADLIIFATGVRPNTKLAEEAGIELGETGAIKVDKMLRTNIEGVYACGDCIEQYQVISGKPIYRPMGSTANKTGRIAGENATGGSFEFRGVLGTGIFRIFDMTVAHTGLSEREAKELGYNVVVCHNIKPDKPEYMGGKEMVIKGVADRDSGLLLGVQIVGAQGVDKRIDVFVTAITFGAKVWDLFHLDLAYAPPFSTAKDPVMYTGMILDNAITKDRKLITDKELENLMNSGEKYNLIDARSSSQYEIGHIDTAVNIPQEDFRESIDKIDKESTIVTYCNKGVTSNAIQNILVNKGFKKVYNLSGGYKHFNRIK